LIFLRYESCQSSPGSAMSSGVYACDGDGTGRSSNRTLVFCRRAPPAAAPLAEAAAALAGLPSEKTIDDDVFFGIGSAGNPSLVVCRCPRSEK